MEALGRILALSLSLFLVSYRCFEEVDQVLSFPGPIATAILLSGWIVVLMSALFLMMRRHRREWRQIGFVMLVMGLIWGIWTIVYLDEIGGVE